MALQSPGVKQVFWEENRLTVLNFSDVFLPAV